ncbi:MAG: type 1 glutamine amidotransferase [Alphaproteobacteria bacterium]|nr:type 1 glutamine amidotransferase [Alphaproteobacteria bacterium]
MLRLLVIEGNTSEGRARAAASGGTVASDHYAEVLRALSPGAVIDICYPADPGANLPDRMGLAHYDGIAITGSALNVYDGGPAIEPQVELMRQIYRSGTPCFGSCWGLQVATVAAGGTVIANPRGREIGFARDITLNEAGLRHPMYEGKSSHFDAIAVHLDEVALIPEGMTVLAANAWSPVQAAEIRHDGGLFWGVQYHPEYTFGEIASVFRRYGKPLFEQGIFRTEEEKQAFVVDLATLEASPTDPALVWRFGLGPAVTDKALRTLEIRNWIEHAVKPAKSTRGRA